VLASAAVITGMIAIGWFGGVRGTRVFTFVRIPASAHQ